MGKTEDLSCVCDGWAPQNAAHLQRCPWIGDGMGRWVDQAGGSGGWRRGIVGGGCEVLEIIM